MDMGTATAPQPAIPDDTGWLIAAYTAQLAEIRQEMAETRREIIAAKAGRGDSSALTLLELRMADRDGILLDFERKLDEMRRDTATMQSVEQAVARRKAMDAAPPAARPVRRRRRTPGRHADGQGELFPVLTPIDGAKTAPALLPLAGIGAWSRHAAAVKLTAGGVAAGFAVASVAATAAHREPYILPWPSQPQQNHAQLAPALSVPLDPDAPLLARTFPASYPGKHHKPATVTLTAPALTVPVLADPAPAPAPSQSSDSSQPSGSSQPSDWSQSSDSSQPDQWSQQDQQDQQGNGDHGGDNWQHANWQNANGQGDQGQGWQQYQGRHRGNGGQQDQGQGSQGGNGSQGQQGNGNGHGDGGNGGPGWQGNGNGNGRGH